MTAQFQVLSPERPIVVFDVLGTLVDQAGSLRRRVSAVTGFDREATIALVDGWLDGVAEQEQAIVRDDRGFASSDQLDAEVLQELARRQAVPAEVIPDLVGASAHSTPWDGAAAAIRSLANVATVVGLSNASRRALTGLSVTADFRWHQLLSAEDARTYKPDPAMYELAMSSVPETALPPFMVAAHAWDLRAAKAVGMRTAYVPRPNADGPRAGERFDLHATSLEDLEAQLRAELP